MARRLGEIFEEARRRRVFQTTGVYIVAVWGLSQGAVQVAPALDLSPSIVRWILMGGIWMIEDLGSRNGTLLDDKRVAAPAALSVESVLRVNEAGPLLRLEHVAAGAAFHAAVMQFRDGPSVAQIRASARGLEPPRGGGPVRS